MTARALGYTLVEMVAVITILGLVGSVTSYVVLESMRVYARAAPAMDAAYQARLAVERMKREIRDLEDTAAITSFLPTALTFVDSSRNTIAYAASGSTLLRNGDLLARGLSALTFGYRRGDASTALVPSELRLVEIDLTVQSGGQPFRIQTAVFPRALGP